MTKEEYSARLAEGDQKGWVYFIEAGPSGPIKVGWAKDPPKRMRTLQIGHPEELNLIGVIPGTLHLEFDLHRRLRYARVLGEWFDRGAVLKLVRPVIKSHGIFLTADVSDSRNSPGMIRSGKIPKRDFIAYIQRDR